jgi:glycosyltransferase involved in cell wall biosynthesis
MYRVQKSCIKLADHVIFQSQFCVETFKDIDLDSNAYTVISNGVDQTVFSIPQEPYCISDLIRIVSGSWSSNLMKGHAVIAAFSELPNTKVTFIGNWPKNIEKKNVILFPPKHQKDLAQEFQKHNIFLFPSKNEACPNIVLEALSCGLPILYDPSGGTKEIASEYGGILTGNHANDLAQMMKYHCEYKNRILRDLEKFSVSLSASLYADVFYRVLFP